MQPTKSLLGTNLTSFRKSQATHERSTLWVTYLVQFFLLWSLNVIFLDHDVRQIGDQRCKPLTSVKNSSIPVLNRIFDTEILPVLCLCLAGVEVCQIVKAKVGESFHLSVSVNQSLLVDALV